VEKTVSSAAPSVGQFVSAFFKTWERVKKKANQNQGDNRAKKNRTKGHVQKGTRRNKKGRFDERR